MGHGAAAGRGRAAAGAASKGSAEGPSSDGLGGGGDGGVPLCGEAPAEGSAGATAEAGSAEAG